MLSPTPRLPQPRRFSARVLSAYAASPVLVGLMTWTLLSLQQYLSAQEGRYVRPFSIGYILPVVLITIWGGSGAGLLTFLLSLAATGFVLIEPHYSLKIARPGDMTEFLVQIVVGGILMSALDLALRARKRSEDLLRESEEAREILRDSEERFRSLVASSAQMVWQMGADGTLRNDLPEWREYTGQTPEQVANGGWTEAVHPDDRERVGQAWAAAQTAKNDFEAEYRVRRRDGAYRWFQARGIALPGASGAVREWVGTWTDIHERVTAEAERERILQAAQTVAAHEALLNRIGKAQRGLEDPEAVQQVAVEELGQMLGADRCYFVVFDTPRDRAHIGTDWHRDDIASLRGEYRLSDFGVEVSELFRAGEPQAIADIHTDPRFGETGRFLLAQMNHRAVLTVPLMDDGQTVTAALSVAKADTPREWTPEEINLVEAVAAQTRSTMTAARLHQRERYIAERLQNALQPAIPDGISALELASFYRSALSEASIGGDFFDIFLVEKGCIALVVGDLSGKGLDAAAQIATVRNMLRFALYRARSVSDAVMALNDTLVEHNLLSGFATLFVGLHDTGAGSLTFASCGHEPALLRRAATGEVEELAPTGPVLGAFADARYTQASVSLAPGDTLAIFTDGFTEAGRNRHEYFGVAGIASVLADMPSGGGDAEAVKEKIVRAVEAHSQGRSHDDQCLLVAVINSRG